MTITEHKRELIPLASGCRVVIGLTVLCLETLQQHRDPQRI